MKKGRAIAIQAEPVALEEDPSVLTYDNVLSAKVLVHL